LGEIVSNPSEVELPWAVKGLYAPAKLVGISIDPRRAPASVYSSNQTSVDAVVPAASPLSPTRYKIRSPGLNGIDPVIVCAWRLVANKIPNNPQKYPAMFLIAFSP
jgi:hypothetical protein